VIGRLPIFIDGELWGFSAVLTYLETLVELSGMESFSDRYYFQLSKNNPNTGEEEFFLPINEKIELELFQSVDFTEGDWKLYANRINSVRPLRGVFVLITIFLIGGIMVGFLFFKIFMKPFELEELLEKKSEELLKSREEFKQNSELLVSVLESPKRISIFSLDKDYNYIAFNNNHSKFVELEFDTSVQTGVSIFSFVPKNEKTAIKARYDRALNGESFEYIRRSVSKSGNTMFWQNWYNPIRNKNREIIGITVFSVDITENIKAEHKLEQNEKRYRTLISSSPYCIHELDRKGKLISINKAGLKMFRKEKEEEVLGLTYSALVGKKNQPIINDAVLNALSGKASEVEISARNGFYLSSFIPLKNDEGDVIKIMGITQDITERKKAEDFVENSLREKTMLLEEIHHRVKNNLAIVSGLLELQKTETGDEYLTEAFDQSINRIISIAMVHELMYKSEDLSSVNVHSYLDKLIPAISATMQNKAQNVEFDIDIDEYKLNINQAIPLGLLLNELITNSFKYAFNGRSDNRISIHLTGIKNNLLVHYADNGSGFNTDIDFNEPKNLGLNLIHAQLAQLGANYEVVTQSRFQLNFTFKVQGRGSHSNIKN
ncbi:MAG: PAS domain-containing protein, partial [Balneolales bacterium]|nr:PAS domain-containing protein [Balneolales bacterium]